MAVINKVAHVVLNVRDVEASMRFYAEALGMEIVVHRAERQMAFLSFGAQHHDIALFGAAEGAERGALGLHHIAFQIEGGIEELTAVHDRLLSQGYQVEDVVDRGIIKSLHIQDPDGNRLEVLCEAMEPEAAKQYLRDSPSGSMPLTLGEPSVR